MYERTQAPDHPREQQQRTRHTGPPRIETNATPNVVSGATGGTVNRLLFSNGL